ncbi:MAG: methyltransferase domain-containing protein [Candidatus Methanomethyliaceae archaeon]|nr:methyltransferase domain-containing protein [Candidatus Methanomethyliaceae archaeon]MDW7971087.1 methyltransferase domain-containing protein [Nitrososphaerota archaeon]
MLDRRKIIEVFDSIAEDFDRTRRKIWRSLEDAGPFSENIILDLGAGSGRNSRYMAERGARLIIAADVSIGMLRRLIMKLNNRNIIEPIRCDALYLPFKSSIFDKVIFIATIHHIPEKRNRMKAIEEVYRVLKKNGTLLITAWARIQLRFLKKLPSMIKMYMKGYEFGDLFVPWKDKMRFYHLFTLGELKSLVKNAGFIIERAYGEKVNSRIFAENCVVIAKK